MTYTEVLIAGSLGMLCAGAIIAFSLFSGRSLLAMSNYIDLDAQSRTALDTMSKQIRRAQTVTVFAPDSITLKDGDDQPLQFTFNSSTHELARIKDGKTTVLLKGCDWLKFDMFDREPSSGTFDLDPVTDPAQCKAIFVSWQCSRKFIDTKLNTANMATATIVLRMK